MKLVLIAALLCWLARRADAQFSQVQVSNNLGNFLLDGSGGFLLDNSSGRLLAQ